tara:strand:+ start:258 stop:761 length:504 start_codon:yes stop_codon:yes gene_type:complete
MRISGGGSGNVNVLQSDAGQFRNADFVTSQNGAFVRGAGIGGNAAEYTHIQCLNPAASGVVTLIDAIDVSVFSDSVVVFAHYDTELATKSGDFLPTLMGGSNGQTEFRWDQNGAQLGTTYFELSLLASMPRSVVFREPLQLAAEEGFLVYDQSTNIGMNVVYFVREV